MSAVNDRWIDFSFFRPPYPGHPAREGAKGVLRYLSEVNDQTRGKIISKAEFDGYVAAGLDVVLNFEWYEGRMLEGAAAGAHDGAVALQQAKAVGYAKGASIYFSHDTGQNNIEQIAAYLAAAEKAMGGYYQADMYGGSLVYEQMHKRGLIRYGWQAMAASWSGGSVGSAALLQNGKSWYYLGRNKDGNDVYGADENLVRKTVFGSHLQARGKVPAVVSHSEHVSHAVVGKPVHTVVPGDSLSSIAAAWGVTLAALEAANPALGPSAGRDWNLIHPGDMVHHP